MAERTLVERVAQLETSLADVRADLERLIGAYTASNLVLDTTFLLLGEATEVGKPTLQGFVDSIEKTIRAGVSEGQEVNLRTQGSLARLAGLKAYFEREQEAPETGTPLPPA